MDKPLSAKPSTNINIIKNSPFGGWGAFGAWLPSLLFGIAVMLFFGLAYPHHLHFQEQYQLFLFDSTYVWDIVKQPGGVADLLGRFCTQFFLFAWVGAFIIALLLVAVQILTIKIVGCKWLYGVSFVPSFLLWIFLLDENALLGGAWAVLLTLLIVWGAKRLINASSNRNIDASTLRAYGISIKSIAILIIAIPLLYIMVGCPLPTDRMWFGVHYHRYPAVFPWLLWAAIISVIILVILARWINRKVSGSGHGVTSVITFALVATVMGTVVWKNANFKAEKIMQYDFMATHQQWNRIITTINKEKPNNQIGVTVQNLALAMRGMLADQMFNYNQNGLLGLLPDVQTDATSPMPTAEVFYQLGMINMAQRTVFEAQEAILDFQKSARCYKRLAQTNLINGDYEVARKYLTALQKTLFYSDWADETIALLGNEEAIAKHPEYGHLRSCVYKNDFYFGDHTTVEMLQDLYRSNKENRLAYDYLMAYYVLTGDVENFKDQIVNGENPEDSHWHYYLQNLNR